MTITSDTMTTLASGVAVLTALRALAKRPAQSISEALDVADGQAMLLQDMLPGPASELPAQLATLIPSIVIEYVRDLPVPGTSFWATGRWHIHVRATDPTATHAFTLLHQLKHIIDHPVRRQISELSSDDWEALANSFAARMLVSELSAVTIPRGKQ